MHSEIFSEPSKEMNSQYETQWEQCLGIIHDNLANNEEAYQAFFARNKVLSYTDNLLVLQIPSHFVYEHLENEYLDLLKMTLQRVYGPKVRLEYLIILKITNNTGRKRTAPSWTREMPWRDSYC